MFNYSLIALCFLNFFSVSLHSYHTKLFNSAVVSFLPNLKLHNVVMVKKETKLNKFKQHRKHLSNEKNKSNDFSNVYVFDYTPKQQPDAIGYIKMFLGYKLPGIVRVIYIEKSNEEKLIEDWYKLVMENPDYKKCLKKFGDKRVNNIIEKWDAQFNVYSHNCKHFSCYFSKEIGKLKNI